jgi:hypothetical protein
MMYKTLIVFRVCLICLLVLSGSVSTTYAQDLLILKSGKELKVSIVEDGTDIIKYREFGDPSGPLYTVAKANVASIRYEKGSKMTQETKPGDPGKAASSALSDGSKTPALTAKKKNVFLDGVMQAPRSVRLIMEDQPEAFELYQSGRKLYRLSNSCAFGVIITSFIVSQSVNKKETSEEKIKAGIPGLVIDGGFIVAAIIMSSAGKSKIRSSVDMYNSSLNKPVSYKLDFGLQENGIGLAIKF